MKILASMFLAGSVLLLSGCGIRGDLERPPPIWGPDERTEDERAHETDRDNASASSDEGGAESGGGGEG